MQITKLTSTDAFVVVDLPTAPVATGVARQAKKILQDGAVNLARTLTYTYAAFGMQRSGASAGINAEGDARDAALAAFVEELGPQVSAGTLLIDAGKGVGADELAAWSATDPRSALRTDDGHVALATGVAAAAAAALGGLVGRSVVVEAGPAADAIATAVQAAGATAAVLPTAEALAAECDACCVGSKPGLVDHQVAPSLRAAVLVPTGPLPVTARGLAEARRAGVRVLADFVTTAGPVLVAWDHTHAEAAAAAAVAGEQIAAAVAAGAEHPEGDLLAACYRAEEFLRTWVDELPFGRPLA